MSRWIEGTVVENIHWTEALYSVRVKADLPPFTAGQFGRLALEIDGEMIGRSYSFVNSPDEDIHEFYSIVVPEGKLSPKLAALEPGDKIFIGKKGLGLFTLKNIPSTDTLWMLSTGTGIGPFLSILKTEEPWQRFKKLVLVHAVRFAEELVYKNHFERFERDNPEQFQFIPMVSREETDFAMPGRITTALEDGSLQKRADRSLTAADSQVMICGNPNMVKDAREILERWGLEHNTRRKPGHYTTEKYW